ncbi:uncharacterized protein LOC122382380 [Amphibalanus amphitrite]|uniref:uncharacterized protein LOC122382380 n=1 Tax=Amphibalanus amphitrite TaxID=1232801 RepID=UPI001C9048D3|nr:uncharacterized protein LOC122382380 [Amphibalanus amphitrite]
MAETPTDARLDVRLIDAYDGTTDVVEWYSQAELLCEYRGASLAQVLPMRLKGGAFAVWSQLPAEERCCVESVRDALFAAFAMDDYAAHAAFTARTLEPGESVDVYLASLRRYAALFGGVSERQLAAAFVNGLPPSIGDTVRAGAKAEKLTLASTLARARAVLGNNQVRTAAAAHSADVVLGMSGITALGGVCVQTPTDVSFRVGAAAAAAAAAAAPAAVGSQALKVDAPDFTAEFSPDSVEWTVGWKWTGGVGPDCLCNTVPEYKLPVNARPAFDAEITEWIENGWLQPYDEETDGPPRGLLPLMAVEQPSKVRPVLDYRELNGHVTAHTADADVCADQLRKWRRHGSRVAVVDLRKAYLQLRLERRLWPYQTVVVLELDERVQRGVLAYVDDMLVDEDIVSAEEVVQHFQRYGLECKPPQRAADGARMLGLRVSPCGGELRWRRDAELPPPPVKVTRRTVFAWCGRLVAHLPVAGWLRPAAAWIKRRVNSVTTGWDDATDDAVLQAQVAQVVQRLQEADPAQGPWRLTGDRLVVWTDASSIANGVVLEDPGRGTVEDACWLRAESKADMHINMAELDAALSGINMAVAWGVKVIDLRTDSATVHRWISDALSGRARLRTKAHGELLIRRRIEIIRQLVDELQLSVTIGLVRSADNPADGLTRVPKQWLQSARDTDPARRVVAAGDRESGGSAVSTSSETDRARARRIHETTGHQGIRRTLWYVRRELGPAARRSMVREIVQQCDICQSIDPAPVRWQTGSLGVQETA